MNRDRLPILLLALAVACAPPACRGEDPEAAAAARKQAAARAAFEKLAAAAEASLAKARSLAGRGETDAAWEEWRSARDQLGETPEVADTADAIRTAEKAGRRDEEYEAALAALNADTAAATEEERLKALERALGVGRAFLENYPESPNRAEIEAGLEYAEGERKRHADYLAALDRARKALSSREPEKALAAAREALALLDREPAREIEKGALSALAPEGMVYVPAGFFLAGKGAEKTFCAGFYIDRHEVTNERYSAFLKATGHRLPATWVTTDPPAGKEKHPVTSVALEDALAFAEWAGIRLPTELEWERAARGTDGRAYPWGNEWDPAKGNFAPDGTLPVQSKPFDRSPEGCFDMAGNVMEMTLATEDPSGATRGPVIKGGHWSDDFHPEYATTFSRWPVDRAHQDVATGFRGAKSLP